MNFFKEVIASLLKQAEVFSGHSSFRVADPKAVGENPIREYTLDAVPLDGDQVMVSLSQDGGEKAFEKTLSSDEAKHIFTLISSDLAEAVSLTSEQKYDAAKAAIAKVLKNYAETTDTPVDVNLPNLHNTQASLGKTALDIEQVKSLFHSIDPKYAELLANTCMTTDEALAKGKSMGLQSIASKADDKIWREAKITMQNLWFSNTDELLEYQQKQKGTTSNQDHIPLWDAQKGKAPAKDTMAPASLSYEDAEKQKEKQHEDMQDHIDEKIKTELESALQQKAASVFGPDQVELVQVLRKNGRNWDEIKKILVKDFGFDKDSTNIFVDEQRQGTDPTGIDVEPVKEDIDVDVKEKSPLTPPEELVSPETHDQLLKDHEDKKKDKPVEEPNFTPKDVMDIPEDAEIHDESSLDNEIARADNDEIHKAASKNCACGHDDLDHKMGPGNGKLPDDCEKCKCKKFHKKASVKTAADDLNPLQEPIQEAPTTSAPSQQDKVPMGKPKDHDAPQKGDRVFVSSDLSSEKAGFEGTFISSYQSKGTEFSIVETDQGDLLDIESHRVTKTSDSDGTTGAQEVEPVSEPQIAGMPDSDEITVTPKMSDFHSLANDSFLQIKKEAEALLEEVKRMGKKSYLFVKKGLEKHASDSAFEGNGWCRVWVTEDEIAADGRYAEALKLPDENARIEALKEIARQIAHEALRLADSEGAKVGVQSWFDSLSPSDHDRIDWVALASPKSSEDEDEAFELEQFRKYGPDAVNPDFKDQIIPKSSLEPKVKKIASNEEWHTCPNCKEDWPCNEDGCEAPKKLKCNNCTNKNKNKKASDFKKGISQNKDSAEKCKCGHAHSGDVCDDCKCTIHHEASLAKEADPVDPAKTQFKDYKITPKYAPKEQAIPATPELDAVLSKMDALQQNLATLEAARKQIAAKLQEEMAKVDQTGGRVEMEAELQQSIEKAAVIIDAVESKVVQWKDKLYTLQTEEVSYVPKLTPKEMLSKIYAKFNGAEKYVQDVLNGMLAQAKNVVEKTLIQWPNKKSSVNKEASMLDEMNHINDELMAALKELSSPL